MSHARRSLSTTRRSLLTAAAAGALLSALWFVPSANADSGDAPAESRDAAVASANIAEQAHDVSAAQERDAALADTGSIDTTPYVVGGALFLGLGGGLVGYSMRRERRDELPVF